MEYPLGYWSTSPQSVKARTVLLSSGCAAGTVASCTLGGAISMMASAHAEETKNCQRRYTSCLLVESAATALIENPCSNGAVARQHTYAE